jgi:hypothetical protein
MLFEEDMMGGYATCMRKIPKGREALGNLSLDWKTLMNRV